MTQIKSETLTIKLTKWTGTFFCIIGACTMALFGYDYPEWQIWMFVSYTIGTALWTVISKLQNDNPLLAMNLVFLIINLIAIFTRL